MIIPAANPTPGALLPFTSCLPSGPMPNVQPCKQHCCSQVERLTGNVCPRLNTPRAHTHKQKQQRGSEWKGKTEESPACCARLRCPFKYPLLVPRFCSAVTAKSMSREKTDLKILVTSPRAIEAHDKIHHLTSTRYLLHSWLYTW